MAGRRGRARTLAAAVLVLLLVLGLRGARAQSAAVDDETRSAARQMARDAIELMNADNYAAAEELLRRAYDLVPAPTVAVLRGRALEKLDRLIEAAESYEAARREPSDGTSPQAYRDAKLEAEERLGELRKEIPLLTIKVTGADPSDPRLEVKLDEKDVPGELVGVRRPVDPGQHFIVAGFDETVHDTRWITVKRGEHVAVLMRVDAPTAPPPAPPPVVPARRRADYHRPLGWLGVGVGSAGLVAGITSGVIMLGHKSELDEACRPECPRALEADLVAFRRSRTVSGVSYAVGFTALGIGVGSLLTAPPRARPGAPAVAFSLGPGGVSLSGRLP